METPAQTWPTILETVYELARVSGADPMSFAMFAKLVYTSGWSDGLSFHGVQEPHTMPELQIDRIANRRPKASAIGSATAANSLNS